MALKWEDCLDWALKQGFRRFRLMSYWDEIEPEQGQYDFSDLDKQIATIAKAGGVVSLCVGVKQPRWPEYHWPEWAKDLHHHERTPYVLAFLSAVVKRYRSNPAIVSWQLENEALLNNFGLDIQIDRSRLNAEYVLLKKLDPKRPVILSASNGWGVPARSPIPDIIGFSYYGTMHQNGKYHRTIHRPWLYRARTYLVDQLLGKPTFIHELQLEPWGPEAIWKMTKKEQSKSMGAAHIRKNIAAAKKIKAYPIDLWGLEWWYWRYQNNDPSVWQAVHSGLTQ
jgi:beta-galactosidase GanA